MPRVVREDVRTRFEIEGIHAVIEGRVTAFGNSGKVNCPKKYIGRKVYLVII